MKAVWKFELSVVDTMTLNMPKGAVVLAVQTQNGTPCMWAMVDVEAELEERTFLIAGTGHLLDEPNSEYVHHGTFQLLNGAFVGHVFEDVVEYF